MESEPRKKRQEAMSWKCSAKLFLQCWWHKPVLTEVPRFCHPTSNRNWRISLHGLAPNQAVDHMQFWLFVKWAISEMWAYACHLEVFIENLWRVSCGPGLLRHKDEHKMVTNLKWCFPGSERVFSHQTPKLNTGAPYKTVLTRFQEELL